jgi:HK97 gp10 family phage protein
MKTTVRVEGLSELDDALQDLTRATQRNIVKRVLMAAGQPIADDAQSRARWKSGTLEGSFGVSTKLSRRQKSKLKKESGVEVYAGPGALVQAITEEFGTTNQSPHPMLRPAWDSGAKPALESIKDDMWKEIKKAAERAARKAARLLAKT